MSKTITIKRSDLIIPLENTLDNLEANEIAIEIREPFYKLYKICREANSNISISMEEDIWRTINFYKHREV